MYLRNHNLHHNLGINHVTQYCASTNLLFELILEEEFELLVIAVSVEEED